MVVLLVLFPFCTISGYAASDNLYMVIPVSLIVTIAFAFADKCAITIQDPFGNTINDIAVVAIATDIERDCRELLGEPAEQLPAPLPVDSGGYLW